MKVVCCVLRALLMTLNFCATVRSDRTRILTTGVILKKFFFFFNCYFWSPAIVLYHATSRAELYVITMGIGWARAQQQQQIAAAGHLNKPIEISRARKRSSAAVNARAEYNAREEVHFSAARTKQLRRSPIKARNPSKAPL